MKTLQIPKAKLALFLAPLLLLTPVIAAQTAAISVDRVNYFSQTAASTVVPQADPFTLNFHIRGGTTDMTAWGPAFYIPGSSGVPQSGTNSATNTGTLNFPAAPNNGASFMFTHDFASNAALQAFYPIAPTDGGVYGIKFTGSTPPTPAVFDDGLVFAAGTTYPSVTPQITSVNNGAVWSGNTLRISPTGITTLTFNAFPEYSSTTYGSFIAVGVYSNTNGVVNQASAESYYLPLGDSSVPPNDPVNQPALTQLSIDGSWLTPGVTYTMELQYAILAGQPEEANLNGLEFQGLATYRKLTTLSIAVTSASASASDDYTGDGQSDILFQNSSDGRAGLWRMNGTTPNLWIDLPASSTDWKIVGTGDLTGDGQSDVIFQNSVDGRAGLWRMNGTTPTLWIDLPASATAWKIVGTGDFTGDGQSDILFQNSSDGRAGLWRMNGTTPTLWIDLPASSIDWKIVGAADFTGDGQTDVIFQNSTDGRAGLWRMNGTTPNLWMDLPASATAWKIVGTGDFTGDGQSDVIFQNSTDGRAGLWRMNGTTPTLWIDLPASSTDWKIVNH